MEPKIVNELKNQHKGEDGYVVGSGPSLNYIDKTFFTNKITICVNHTIEHIDYAKALYLVAKEPDKDMQDAAHKHNAKIVMCAHHSGVPKKIHLTKSITPIAHICSRLKLALSNIKVKGKPSNVAPQQ